MDECMKEDIGKQFVWHNQRIEIVDAFSCYEGEFYEYRIVGSTDVHTVNVGKDTDFIMALLDADK